MLKSYIAVKALIYQKDRFLILKTADSDPTNKLSGWETPGGRLEENEDILEGLKRELKEETGLNVEILFPFNTYSANVGLKNNIIGINYLARFEDGKIKLNKNEHIAYNWFTREEIKSLKDSIGLQKELDAYDNFIKNVKNIFT